MAAGSSPGTCWADLVMPTNRDETPTQGVLHSSGSAERRDSLRKLEPTRGTKLRIDHFPGHDIRFPDGDSEICALIDWSGWNNPKAAAFQLSSVNPNQPH